MKYYKWMMRAVVFSAVLAAAPVYAYVGPGAGISLIGSLVGLTFAILVAFGAVLAWPIRRYLKKRREGLLRKSQEETVEEA